MSRAVMRGVYASMSQHFVRLWGEAYTITLVGGEQIEVGGIFKVESREDSVGGYTTQLMDLPRLDVRRVELIDAGIRDPEAEMAGATVEIEGQVYMVDKPRDDRQVMVKLWLAYSHMSGAAPDTP